MRKQAGVLAAVAATIVVVIAWVRDGKRKASALAAADQELAPTRRATAHDPGAMEVATRHQLNAERQRVIDSVLHSHGGRPARQVVPALRTALLANGLSAGPDSWLRAVATELANGNVYMVSQSNVETYATAPRPSH